MRLTRVIASLILMTLGACARSAASLPPNSAEPDVVLNAYLRALSTGDCNTARALATDAFGSGPGELCGPVHVEAYGVKGLPARPNDHEAVFAIGMALTGGDAVNLPEGSYDWFYTLTLNADGAWRVSGGGTGP